MTYLLWHAGTRRNLPCTALQCATLHDPCHPSVICNSAEPLINFLQQLSSAVSMPANDACHMHCDSVCSAPHTAVPYAMLHTLQCQMQCHTLHCHMQCHALQRQEQYRHHMQCHLQCHTPPCNLRFHMQCCTLQCRTYCNAICKGCWVYSSCQCTSNNYTVLAAGRSDVVAMQISSSSSPHLLPHPVTPCHTLYPLLPLAMPCLP